MSSEYLFPHKKINGQWEFPFMCCHLADKSYTEYYYSPDGSVYSQDGVWNHNASVCSTRLTITRIEASSNIPKYTAVNLPHTDILSIYIYFIEIR